MEGFGSDAGTRAPEDESLIQPILEVYLIDFQNGFDAQQSYNYSWRERTRNPDLMDDATATFDEMHLDADVRDSGYLNEETVVNEQFIDRQPAVDPSEFDAGAEVASWFDEGFEVINGPSLDLNDIRRNRPQRWQNGSDDESDRVCGFRRD